MNPRDWIRRRIREGGADSEADTERDGAFSWSGEVHAFAIGFARGAKDPYSLISDLPEGEDEHYQDARDEPGYFYAGSFVGTLLQLGVMGLATLGILSGAGIEVTVPLLGTIP